MIPFQLFFDPSRKQIEKKKTLQKLILFSDLLLTFTDINIHEKPITSDISSIVQQRSLFSQNLIKIFILSHLGQTMFVLQSTFQ